MIECAKCNTTIKDNENVVWKCTKCGKPFKFPLNKLTELPTLIKADGTPVVKCLSCGNGLTENEKIYWKCGGCGTVVAEAVKKFRGEKNEQSVKDSVSDESLKKLPNLIECPDCGKVVSKRAESCPNCGYGIKAYYNKLKQEEEEKRLAEEREQQHQENMNKYFGSPIKKFSWVLAVLFVLISIIAIFASENAKKCEISSCDEYKVEGSDYCREHTCTESGCTSSKSKYDRYCYIHEQAHMCIENGCEKYKYSDSKYCSEHKCEQYGCNEKKSAKGKYCSKHTVDMRKYLRLFEFTFDVNSAGGIELKFGATNLADKQIKYVRFKLEFRNSVGDIIKDEITGKSTVDIEVVGPIYTNYPALIYGDVIGYNDTCGRLDIDEITIVYMDGTQKTGEYLYYTIGMYDFHAK